MNRVEGLKRITSDQEYFDAKLRLENYLKQYKWITETKTPYEDISKALMKCVETRKTYEDKEIEKEETAEEKEARRLVELENENKILALKLQYEAIKGDTYVGNLRRNITALYVSIGDYEARNSQDAQMDLEVKDAQKDGAPLTSPSMRRFRFWLANVTGLVPGEINMDVENRKEIPLYIAENYDLVNKPEITPEHKEMALIVVPDVDTSKGVLYRLVENPVDRFIASRGIREKGTYEKTAQITEDGISVENKFIPREKDKVKAKEQEKTKTNEQTQTVDASHSTPQHGKNDKDEIGQ